MPEASTAYGVSTWHKDVIVIILETYLTFESVHGVLVVDGVDEPSGAFPAALRLPLLEQLC